MLKFNVPFIPDIDYTAFLNKHKEFIYSCHFSLYNSEIPDARHKNGLVKINELSRILNELKIHHKLMLLNSRIHLPNSYSDSKFITGLIGILEKLLDASVITGIVYADQYLIQALSKSSREITSRLEAVPSVNCMIDSYDKLLSYLDILDTTHFKKPRTLILDRSLSRRPDDLSKISEQVKRYHPEMNLELIANEGCIYQCPFKLSHDSQIALGNLCPGAKPFQENRIIGCVQYFSEHPYQLFKSPFIRPEDTAYYSEKADVIKLCGRTLGPRFMKRVISAYIRGRFEGNLLALMDATDYLSDLFHIDNSGLPENFLKKIISCNKSCKECNYCKTLYKNHVTRQNNYFKKLPENMNSKGNRKQNGSL